MRLVVWNCNMRLDAKIERLLALRPDLAVIPECAAPDILRRKAGLFVPSAVEWIGGNQDHSRNKGMAVMAWGAYRLERPVADDPAIHYALPVQVTGPVNFALLAMWAFNNSDGCTGDNPGPLLRAMERYRGFLDTGPAIIAGDFNNHFVFDRPGRACNHANALAEMNRLKMFSAYHRAQGVAAGREPHPTLYWTRHQDKPYHIDYCFLSQHWEGSVGKVEVGQYQDWISHSDHMPLIVDLDGICSAKSPRSAAS